MATVKATSAQARSITHDYSPSEIQRFELCELSNNRRTAVYLQRLKQPSARNRGPKGSDRPFDASPCRKTWHVVRDLSCAAGSETLLGVPLLAPCFSKGAGRRALKRVQKRHPTAYLVKYTAYVAGAEYAPRRQQHSAWPNEEA